MVERAEMAFTNHVGYGTLVGSLSDFFIWNEVTSFDAQNLSEAFGIKAVKLPPLPPRLVFRCQVS